MSRSQSKTGIEEQEWLLLFFFEICRVGNSNFVQDLRFAWSWNWVSPNWPYLSGKEFDALNEGKHWQLMSGMFLPQLILMAAPTACHMGPGEQGSVKGSDTRHSYPCWHFPENCQDYFLQVIFCEWLGNTFGFRWNSLHFFHQTYIVPIASFVTFSGLRYRLCKPVMLALVLLCSIRLMTY